MLRQKSGAKRETQQPLTKQLDEIATNFTSRMAEADCLGVHRMLPVPRSFRLLSAGVARVPTNDRHRSRISGKIG